LHGLTVGLHGLTVLDEETIEWLLNPALRSSAAKQWIEELAQTTKKKACKGPRRGTN